MDRNDNVGSNATLIQRASYLNVKLFLSSHTPQGLVRNSCKEEDTDGIVDFDILDGKVVMICFFSLPLPLPTTSTDSDIARAISYVSSELHAFGAFELVLVVNMRHVGHLENHVSVVNDFMSALPSFALLVPYLDSTGICHFLNFVPGSDPLGVLVNRNHWVEWRKPLNFFLQYGADAYPFTTERFSMITENEMENISEKKLSIASYYLSSRLLSYPTPTSIIRKNPGGGPGKKSIRDFDFRSSNLGLYLCYTGDLIPTLAEVHKNCSDKGLQLDIILVYMPFKDFSDPQSFQDRINFALEEQKVSWWVFPFVYWVSRRLCRLFHGTEDKLIMLDPRNESMEPHGEAVVRQFGIGAYPFFRKRLLERELEKLRELTLESLLVHNSRHYVFLENFNPGFREVPVKALQGKNVLLYLGYVRPLRDDKLFTQLCVYCRHRRACDPDFEMVFAGLDARSFFPLPSRCLVCPLGPEHFEFVSKKIFREGDRCSTLVAFGKDGHICSVRAQRVLSSSCPNFFEDNLRSEIIDELFGNRQLPVCCL